MMDTNTSSATPLANHSINRVPDQPAKSMDVHHRDRVHETRKWKEYFFQFSMLVLAVFLGSFAETKREEWVEKTHEKEYMVSMSEDLKKDTSEINTHFTFLFEQIQKIDSLEILLTHDLKNNIGDVAKAYQLSYYLFWNSTATFNEKTFSHLASSGNMRVVKKVGAADTIVEYYNAVKRIDQQKQQYINYLNLSLAEMYKVFDYTYLRQQLNKGDSTLHWANLDWHDLHLRCTDRDALTDLGATLENTKLVVNNYMQQLGILGQSANHLLQFLHAEYRLPDHE